MGFLADEKVIDKKSPFHLTQLGRDRLQDYDESPQARILVALETSGSLGLDEIAQYARLSHGQVERILPALLKKKHIAQGAK